MRNIFIGVLAESYDRFQDQAQRIFLRERAKIVTTYLLRGEGRTVLRQCCRSSSSSDDGPAGLSGPCSSSKYARIALLGMLARAPGSTPRSAVSNAAYVVPSYTLKMPASACAGGSAPESKLLFISVCLVYFAQSVQLFEDLRRRGAKRVKMTPEASYTIMLDKLHEHVFTLMVHVTNLWVVYATDNVLEAMFNCLAMSFLSDLENDWQTAYYANRLGEAADVYDTVFVTHRENARKMLTRRKRGCFRFVHAAASVVFTVTLAGYALMPVFAAGMLVVGVLCK